MYCDVPEAASYLGYASPATLYRLLKAGLLKEYLKMAVKWTIALFSKASKD